jgi:hypothetical protein
MASITMIAIVLAVATASLGVTEGQRPNFSGTWLLVWPAEAVAQAPGQGETITQTETTITFGHPSEGGGHLLTCGLDGQWRESRIGGLTVSCRGTWEDQKLVLVERATSHDGTLSGRAETTKILSVDGNGNLVMEIKPPPQDVPGGPAKLVFRKR